MKLNKIVIILLLFSFFSTSASFAQGTTSAGFKNPFERVKETFSVKKASNEARGDIAKAKAKAKLDEARLRVCQTKEKVITTRQNGLTRLTGNILDTFDKITQRVEEFYTAKLVPEGKTVSNYNELLANIAAAKAAAQTALDKAKTNSAGFSCQGDDPKGALTAFRENMQTVKKALKDYRTAIKDLIVAVKTAAGGPKESPAPTK